MPKNSTEASIGGDWVELTDNDVTHITFQNIGEDAVFVKATVGSIEPTTHEGAFMYLPGQGEINLALADVFLGVAGANRVWAYSVGAGLVAVSHA